MIRLLLFGPPGVGKGTQAKLLSREFGVPHISTGDMLRAAVTAGTDLGKKAKTIMDKGNLVPDDVMIGIVREVLTSPETKNGFILDGFPRTIEQAKALCGLFDELKINHYRLVNLVVDSNEIIRRLANRFMCERDGRIFSRETDGVSAETPCPSCGGRLFQRDDDKEETVSKRMSVYLENTAPVIEYYNKLGRTIHLDGEAPIEEVNKQIKQLAVEKEN